ncbi:MAG TPA: hypothetical protein VFG42_21810 [Baekduia sp.]|uniref:WD40/YVTN/BNR-like repeat-containing protein n=1 Tax=Baekduia sp. TaxID=2600305 RepID=UPI002D775CC5|nr:hypothetical protein [Baekduia sp.]HET6509449.1 hypothetical protein [Baekduia sp.]
MRTPRSAALGAAAALALLAPAAPAVAGIWSPIASGTTADITAVDDVRQDVLLYGTASGQLLENGAVRATFAGRSINDIALNPSGSIGLAAASNGLLLRTTNHGDSWTTMTLPTTYAQPTPCASTGPKSLPITGNLNAVAWASDTVAYVVAADQGVVLKTVDGGATWADAGRQNDGSCRVNTHGKLLTDVATVPGSGVAWFVDDSFGATSVTTDALATPAPRRATASAVNCFDHRPRLALDVDNPNRAFMVDRCDGALQLGTTTDGGTSWDLSHRYFAGDPDALRGLNDVAIAGGSAMAVGNDGAILIANDTRDVYFQRADGALSTTDWLSVSKREGAHAVVGGAGGALIQTDRAAQIPDVVPPAGTVTGPTTATAGVPVTLTLVAGDDAGGSGLAPAATVWTAPGVPAPAFVPNAVGGAATFTFSAAGVYPVTATFEDLAGNRATAGTTVTVSAPIKGPAPTPTPNPTPATSTRTTTASVPGAKLSLGVPRACVAPGATFRVTLTWKKQKRKGNRFVKVRRADFYVGAKRVKVDTKAPFTQTLTITAGTKSGSTVTVRARAYVKVSKGRSPTKSITTTVKVC